METKKYYLVRRASNGSHDVKVFCGTIKTSGIYPMFIPDGYRAGYGFCPDHVFETEEAANAFAEKLFERVEELGNSYLKDSTFMNDKAFEKLIEIRDYINTELSAFEGYIPACFSDVSSGGILIQGMNEAVRGYAMATVKVPHSFQGYKELAKEFVQKYREYYSDKERVKSAQDFIADGEKYGWD